jgi:hypothetical protein
MESDRYWVALFNEGGERAGVQRELARCSQREEAHLKYKEYAEAYPERPTPYAPRCIGRVRRSSILARANLFGAIEIRQSAGRSDRVLSTPCPVSFIFVPAHAFAFKRLPLRR